MWSLLSNIQRPIVKQKVHIYIYIYIYIPIVEKITFIGLLFLFIETKELCEARGEAKHEKLTIIPPHLKLPELRVNSSLFNAVNECLFETVK